MKKLEVCFMCDHEVDDAGERGPKVEVLNQVQLLRQNALKVSICFGCYKLRYRDLRKTLQQQVAAIKNALDTEDV